MTLCLNPLLECHLVFEWPLVWKLWSPDWTSCFWIHVASWRTTVVVGKIFKIGYTSKDTKLTWRVSPCQNLLLQFFILVFWTPCLCKAQPKELPRIIGQTNNSGLLLVVCSPSYLKIFLKYSFYQFHLTFKKKIFVMKLVDNILILLLITLYLVINS